jgi:kynureninase
MITWEDCVAADAADPLAGFREEFALPDGLIYLDGNSLGARPRAAADVARRVVADEWGDGLIGSWNAAGWFDLPLVLGDLLAPLIGGGPGTTVVTDTTSINLFRALAAAVRLTDSDPGRRVIIAERGCFPTDVYVAEGLVEFSRGDLELRLIDEPAELDAALGSDVAVVTLSHVDYRTGRRWDLPGVTRRVQAHGARMVWDLAHSAGVMPIELTAGGVDFAVGCTYKYLNGGPGAPAFLWVNPRHLEAFRSPLTAWWAHARPFAMEPHFVGAADARRLLTGTQPIVSLALAGCGLEIAARADLAAVRQKSVAMTELFVALVEQRCRNHPLRLVSPRDPEQRGSQISLAHPDAYPVMQALIARGVVGDFRAPDVLRFGLAPLYLRHVDIWDAVEVLRDVLDTGGWTDDRFRRRLAVT